MAGIGGVNNSYSSYVPTYGKTANNDKDKADGAANTNSANEAKSAENTSNVKSKNSTDDYLKQLREKFPKYNIMVGNFDNLYASQKGLNNVVLDPKLVEKMANDPKFAAEMETKINRAMTQGLDLKRNAMAMNGGELTTSVFGFNEEGRTNSASGSRKSSSNGSQGFNSLGSNGANQTVNMFDKMRTSNAENEKRMTEKREAKRAEEKKEKEAIEKERMEEAQEKRAEANRKRLEELYSGDGYNDNLVWEFNDLDSLNAKV